MTKLLSVPALLVFLVCIISATTTSQLSDLKITVTAGSVIDDDHDEVTVRFLNQSDHNLYFARPWITCVGISLSIELEAKLVTPDSPPGPIQVSQFCGLEGQSWPEPPILEQVKSWLALHPTESVDFPAHLLKEPVRVLAANAKNFESNRMLTSKLTDAGMYEFRVVFIGTNYVTSKQRETLERAGYVVPDRNYESNVVTFHFVPPNPPSTN